MMVYLVKGNSDASVAGKAATHQSGPLRAAGFNRWAGEKKKRI